MSLIRVSEDTYQRITNGSKKTHRTLGGFIEFLVEEWEKVDPEGLQD